MEIFSICERVAAFGWSYFRVLCCFFADRSIASVLVRVLHPCVALALWKLLRGCGSCVLIWRAHRNDNMSFVSQALCSCTCVWKLQREKHLRITQCGFHIRASQPRSMWNLRSRPRITVLVIVRISFRLSFGATTKKQKTHASKRNLLLLCMAGSI